MLAKCFALAMKKRKGSNISTKFNQTLKSLLTEIFDKETSLKKGTDEPKRDAMSVASQACSMQEYFPAALR